MKGWIFLSGWLNTGIMYSSQLSVLLIMDSVNDAQMSYRGQEYNGKMVPEELVQYVGSSRRI
jgi:hypothetical protein